MTSEQDFDALLDADPTDWQTRLIYADWLEEKGDKRAVGYRKLGELKVYPVAGEYRNKDLIEWIYGRNDYTPTRYHNSLLNPEWMKRIASHSLVEYWAIFSTRKQAEDTAALAYLELYGN